MENVLAIIRCFEAIFGLTVNMKKSALIGVSADARQLNYFTKLLGCKVDSLPSS